MMHNECTLHTTVQSNSDATHTWQLRCAGDRYTPPANLTYKDNHLCLYTLCVLCLTFVWVIYMK